ncbi:MAG: hypothetical protein ACP5MG_01195 [Verrucomicrobiia bacterium]
MKKIEALFVITSLLIQTHYAKPAESAASSSTNNICYVLSYDHGGVVLWGYEHFIQNFRTLLEWFDRHPKLKMGLDNEAWMYDWLAENQPAILAEIKNALQKYKGRLAIGSCNYGQPLAAFILDESNIRQILYAVDTVKKQLDYDVKYYSWSEHAGFPQLAQILTSAGFKGVLMRTHFMMYGYCPGYDLPIVLWQAPDGSAIPCVPTYVNQERQIPNYSAQPPGPYGLTTEDTWILTRYPSKESPAPLDSFRARFKHITPVVASRIDDTGLKKEQLVAELDTRPDYQWVTLEDLFKKMPRPTNYISPKCDDFGYRMPWGYRGNELFNLCRKTELTVLTAERLFAKALRDAKLNNSVKLPQYKIEYYENELASAWKNLLVAQHHDIQITQPPGTVGREFLITSLTRSRSVISDILNLYSTKKKAEKGYFCAFNPLPWAREEFIAESPDGHLIQGKISVPSLGFATFKTPNTAAQILSNLSFSTRYYKVEVSETGGITSLTTAGGKPIFKINGNSGRLEAVINGTNYTSQGRVTIKRIDTGYSVEERGNIGTIRYTIQWFFPTESRRIECRIKARFSGEKIGQPAQNPRDSKSCFTHEKKLRLIINHTINNENLIGIRDFPFCVETTMRKYIEGNYWTAIADGSGGIAVANKGTMCSVNEGNGILSIPLAFSTEYIWGTEILNGEREWSLAIIPFEGDWKKAEIHRRALEFSFPVIAVPGRSALNNKDFLEIQTPDIFLTAMYVNNGNIYARFFNCSDEAKTIQFSGKTTDKLETVDLWHNPIKEKSNPLYLNKWQFKTYRFH